MCACGSNILGGITIFVDTFKWGGGTFRLDQFSFISFSIFLEVKVYYGNILGGMLKSDKQKI